MQSAIARVQKQLPAEMTDPPSYRKVNPADAPILLLTLSSEIAPLQDMDAFAQQVISPALSTIDGVAQVQVFGSQKYAVRVQLNPDALAARGIGVDEVQAAITAANANTPIGTLKNTKQSLTIQAQTELSNADQFRNIIVAIRDGRPMRLGDLAVVTDSVEDNQTASWYNGTRAILLGVFRQPEANTVEVVDRIKALLPSFESQLPRGAVLNVLNDRSTSIRDAVHDVQLTLGLTIALVIMVIFLFLRKVSATVIPALAVPISLIATLGAMYLLNFSIDNISLLGLTLAVGLVVDDAIVMVENIHRHMEEDGLSAFEAALKGSREIGFTIISISISLVAVFIPVLLMGGIIGRIFNEFAVVVTVAIVASAFVSLTLTPMLAAKILPRPEPAGTERTGWSAHFERGFEAVLRGYDRTLQDQPAPQAVDAGGVLRHAGRHGLAAHRDAQGPVPAGGHRPALGLDRGAPGRLVRGHGRAAAAGGRRPTKGRRTSPAWRSTVGGTALNAGKMYVELKPRSERPALQKVLADLRRDTAQHRRHPDRGSAGAEPADRRPVEQGRISVRGAGPRPAAALRMVAEDGRRDEPRSAVRRRQQRPPGQRHAGDARRRQGQGQLARHLGGATALDAVFRLRQPAGVDHLRHRRQLFRGDGVQRQGQLDDRRTARRPHPQQQRQARADRRLRADRTNGRLADHQPARPASGGDAVVQSAGRRCRSARRWRGSTS